MKIGIAIDGYKLNTFTKHLSVAGYTFNKSPGLTGDTLLLTVETHDKDALEKVIRAANTEAAIRRGGH